MIDMHIVKQKEATGVICTDNASACTYLLSVPALRRCPRGSAYIDLDAGLEVEEEKGNV